MSYNLQDDLQGLREAAKNRSDYEGERLDVFYNYTLYNEDGLITIPEHLSLYFDNKLIMVGFYFIMSKAKAVRTSTRPDYSDDNGYHRILKAQLASALIDVVSEGA